VNAEGGLRSRLSRIAIRPRCAITAPRRRTGPGFAQCHRPERVGSTHSTKGRTRVKAVVLYRPAENPDAFERYYADTHTALAKAIPGLQRFEAAQGIATPDGGAVPYQRIAELTFEDMDALQAAWDPTSGRRPSMTSRTSPPAA
jgi:uncharacterized protein (TIGR02118 family)